MTIHKFQLPVIYQIFETVGKLQITWKNTRCILIFMNSTCGELNLYHVDVNDQSSKHLINKKNPHNFYHVTCVLYLPIITNWFANLELYTIYYLVYLKSDNAWTAHQPPNTYTVPCTIEIRDMWYATVYCTTGHRAPLSHRFLFEVFCQRHGDDSTGLLFSCCVVYVHVGWSHHGERPTHFITRMESRGWIASQKRAKLSEKIPWQVPNQC